jgi:NAD(P)-dependent dehydrogenase (short-subunit alcohol dehydrogenase family)
LTSGSQSKETIGAGWDAGHIPWQVGRRAIITGANSGIGFHAALELARKGAHVVMACRDVLRGQAAMARIGSVVPDAAVEVSELDLASLASVRSFAARELAQGLPLDLLINNAGVYRPKHRMETADGFELQFGTNVLGHFALTGLLLPALKRAVQSPSQRPRVVTVASIAHKRARINFDDLQSERSYDSSAAYGQSKLANLMFALELPLRLRDSGPPAQGIMSVAAHPGVAGTSLFQGADRSAMEQLARRGVAVAISGLLNSDTQGALPTLFAATSTEAIDGGYYGPQGLAEARGGDVGVAKIAPQALDQQAAARLWQECERLTGVSLS